MDLDTPTPPAQTKKTKHQGGDPANTQPPQKKRKVQQSPKSDGQKPGGQKGSSKGRQDQNKDSQNNLKRKATPKEESPNKKAKVQPEGERPPNPQKKSKKQKQKEAQELVEAGLTINFAKGKLDLKIRDLQDLVLWAHRVNPNAPAWVTVDRVPIQKVVVFLIDSLNAIDFNLDNFPAFKDMFPDHPSGIPTRGAGGKHRVYPGFSVFLNRTKPQPKSKSGSPAKQVEEVVQPDQFLLDAGSLTQLDYPRDGQPKFTNFHKFKPATPQTKAMVALDCEMCRAEDGNLQLARISVVDTDETVLYDKFIKPTIPITDYLTRWSGITEEVLNSATAITFDTMMEELSAFLSEETIFIGHSLENDMLAMKLIHTRVLDTSVLYPHQIEGHKNSLKYLAEKFLNEPIQGGEHDSVQDALATLRLAQLFLKKGTHPNLSTKAASALRCEQHLSDQRGSPIRLREADQHHALPVNNGFVLGPALSQHEKPQENIVTALKQNKKESSVFASGYLANMVRNTCPGINSVTCNSDAEIFNKIMEAQNTTKPHFIFSQLLSFTDYWRSKSNEDFFGIGDSELRQKEIKGIATEWNAGIKKIYDNLEPNTLFIVFTGNGNIQKTKGMIQKKTQAGSSWLPQEEKALQDCIKEARQGFAWVRLKPKQEAKAEGGDKMELEDVAKTETATATITIVEAQNPAIPPPVDAAATSLIVISETITITETETQ